MKRTLHAVPPPAPRIPFAMLRRALVLYRSDFVSREVRHANARAWIRARLMLGKNHVLDLSKPAVRWGAHQNVLKATRSNA